MKTKEEIIQALRGSKIVMINTGNPRNAEYIQHAINYIESMPKIHEELSTLNPMKIDEERFKSIYNSLPSLGFEASFSQDTVKEYNSTLEDHQVLQPLPSEIPKELRDKYIKDDSYFLKDMWQELIKHYGTPTKKELVSVEKLDEEICALHRVIMPATSKLIAQHIVDTYSLNPPKREWWMDLKEGDKFKDGTGGVFIFDGMFYIGSDGVYSHPANKSTPYIEPSIHDKVKEKLGIELYEEFMKEVKGA